MALEVKHTTQVAQSNNSDHDVSSTAWNQAHTFTGTAGKYVVFDVNGVAGEGDAMPLTGGTFTGDILVPDEAYSSSWNASLEVPTKNAVYDKIETVDAAKANLSGATFTGDISVPDEAYGVAWNASVEVPTKNAVYDKIEALDTAKANLAGGTFTGDISVPDEAYGVAWNASVEVPTKNAVYDKVEALDAAKANLSGGNTFSGNQSVTGTIGASSHVYVGQGQTSGTLYAHMFQSYGNNQGWPGVADGYFAAFPNDVNGFIIGGYGTSRDVSLFNRNGSVAFGVLGNSVNVKGYGNIEADGTITAVGKIGYATGAGGTVTQLTSKSTAVTINELTGEITMNAAALAAATVVTFAMNNSTVEASDMIVISHHSGGTIGPYLLNARATGAGTASIAVRNTSAGSLSEAIVLKYAVIKAVTT